MRYNLKRFLSLALCAALSVSACAVAAKFAPVAEAKTVAEYNSDLEAAKAESNALKKKIASLKAENAPYQAQKAALESQIAAVHREIELYEAQKKECEETIARRTEELATTKEQFKQRLVALYMMGNTELVVLLSADDYGDYLSKAELVESVSKHDAEMIKSIIAAIEELKLAEESLKVAEEEIKAKKAELMEAFNAVNAIVKNYSSQISSLNSDLADIQKEQKEIEQAIKNAQKPQGSTGGATINGTGNFTWPVPGYYKVSSYYGPRWGRNHNGIDIIGSRGSVYGATIVAADSGTVILNKYYGGYGNCVIIDHGNGYTTLYAHMKSRSRLTVGTSVTKGQTVVGYVGDTGNVTGPHLHFEVRKNGSYVNPMRFFN